MSKQNRDKFDSYPEGSYFKTNEKAEKHFQSILKFPKTLGFDEKNHGFIVLHKKHQASGIEQEIPACNCLKILGWRVELVEEYTFKPSVDVAVNDCLFEIKRISKALDVTNAVMVQFKRCEKKSPNLILHVDQKVEPSNLKRAIRKASERYDKIKEMILIFRKTVIELDKVKMQKGDYRL